MTTGGVIAAILFAWSSILTEGNAELKQELFTRQAEINQGAKLRQPNNQLINTLARLAAITKDQELTKLFNENGINCMYSNASPGTFPESGPIL